ncbi:MAG: hypothetical protein ABIH21_02005 [Patescibacteria group bacterium]
MKREVVVIAFVGVFILNQLAFAAMNSTNYQIKWDTVSTGGADDMSSASYQLRATGGNQAAGASESATYQMSAGYRAGIYDQVIRMDIYIQNKATGVVATGISGATVTVDPSGFSVDEFVIIVQDDGLSQITGIGQIISLGVDSITLDELKYGSSAPVIDGTNDYVYHLNSSSLNLGEILVGTPGYGVIGLNATADITNGYTVQLYEDGNFRRGGSSAVTIDDVFDGQVSAVWEEYGAISSDTTLANSTFDTQDSAITSDFQEIVSESVVSFESRNYLTIKAGANGNTAGGDYGHALSFIISGNY